MVDLELLYPSIVAGLSAAISNRSSRVEGMKE